MPRKVNIFSTALATGSSGPNLDDFVRPDGASARVFSVEGNLLRLRSESANAQPLGSPVEGLSNYGQMRVATARITGDTGATTGFVQYGRSIAHVDSTVDRLWLFIAAGILGGTLLASLGGVAIAARAMRPISALTATARQIAATGDPSRHMPDPKAEDEVGELARTLEQMLRSLDAARTEREAAMKKQREFVADASHELRTPLTSVLANLELLQASLRQPQQDEDRAMVDSALRSSRRMSRLVADLLLLARADAGRVSTRRPCDLAEVAGNAAAEVAPVLGDRELAIENDRPLQVEGNPDELHRMVLNLLDNAARHTPARRPDRAAPEHGGRRRGGRGGRRRPGHPGPDPHPGLRPLRPRRRPGRHRRRPRQRPRPGDSPRRGNRPRRHGRGLGIRSRRRPLPGPHPPNHL